jgi:hypothetical protein
MIENKDAEQYNSSSTRGVIGYIHDAEQYKTAWSARGFKQLI